MPTSIVNSEVHTSDRTLVSEAWSQCRGTWYLRCLGLARVMFWSRRQRHVQEIFACEAKTENHRLPIGLRRLNATNISQQEDGNKVRYRIESPPTLAKDGTVEFATQPPQHGIVTRLGHWQQHCRPDPEPVDRRRSTGE